MEGGRIMYISYSKLVWDDRIDSKYSFGAAKQPGGGLVLFIYWHVHSTVVCLCRNLPMQNCMLWAGRFILDLLTDFSLEYLVGQKEGKKKTRNKTKEESIVLFLKL